MRSQVQPCPRGFRYQHAALNDFTSFTPPYLDTDYVLLEKSPGPMQIVLSYELYASKSVARADFLSAAKHQPKARMTSALKPYRAFLAVEKFGSSHPPSSAHCTQPKCFTSVVFALVGNVIVNANAGLGPQTGDVRDVVKLGSAAIHHLHEVEHETK